MRWKNWRDGETIGGTTIGDGETIGRKAKGDESRDGEPVEDDVGRKSKKPTNRREYDFSGHSHSIF